MLIGPDHPQVANMRAKGTNESRGGHRRDNTRNHCRRHHRIWTRQRIGRRHIEDVGADEW